MTSEKPRKFRWKIGLGIVLLGVIATFVAWVIFPGDMTMRVMSLYMIWPATCFFTLLWWLFLSGLHKRTRWFVFSMLAAAAGLAFVIVGLDKSDGAMIPRFVWRWEDPLWPSLTFLAVFAWTFFTRFPWKTRLIGSGSAAAVAAILVLVDVPGFQLRATVGEYAGAGERSDESFEFERRVKTEERLQDVLKRVMAAVGSAPRAGVAADSVTIRFRQLARFPGAAPATVSFEMARSGSTGPTTIDRPTCGRKRPCSESVRDGLRSQSLTGWPSPRNNAGTPKRWSATTSPTATRSGSTKTRRGSKPHKVVQAPARHPQSWGGGSIRWARRGC